MLDKWQRSKKKKLIGHQNRRVRVGHLPFPKKNPPPNKSNRVIIKASLRTKIKAVFKISAVRSGMGRT